VRRGSRLAAREFHLMSPDALEHVRREARSFDPTSDGLHVLVEATGPRGCS
jgi:hypothetical protein